MSTWWENTATLLSALWTWIAQTITLLVGVVPGGLLMIVWIVWWLWAINWKKAWPVLARGGWAPVLLLMYISAEAWSRIVPSDCACLGFRRDLDKEALMVIPNFWWQLGSVATLVAIALFCGWLQGVMHWAPAEMAIEPPPASHDHALDHGHAHH